MATARHAPVCLDAARLLPRRAVQRINGPVRCGSIAELAAPPWRAGIFYGSTGRHIARRNCALALLSVFRAFKLGGDVFARHVSGHAVGAGRSSRLST